MQLHLSDLNITLTANDILEAIKSSDSNDLESLRSLLNKIEVQLLPKIRRHTKRHRKQVLPKCANKNCQKRFEKKSPAQKYCSIECGLKPRPKKETHLPNTMNLPGHITGKKFRDSEDNPFV